MPVYVTHDSKLLMPIYIHELAKRLVALNLSRLETTLWLGSVLYAYEGNVFDGTGRHIPIWRDVVEEVYGDDLACSWNSAVKVFATRLPKRKAKNTVRMRRRLQLFDAAFRILGQPIEV
jgi:hypothetical protein